MTPQVYLAEGPFLIELPPALRATLAGGKGDIAFLDLEDGRLALLWRDGALLTIETAPRLADQQAQAIAHQLNEAIGLSRSAAAEIVTAAGFARPGLQWELLH
jgi:hypothetical protein